MIVHCKICAEFVPVFGLCTNTCYLDDGKLFIVCKKRLKILNFIHLASTFALEAVLSIWVGTRSTNTCVCVYVCMEESAFCKVILLLVQLSHFILTDSFR